MTANNKIIISLCLVAIVGACTLIVVDGNNNYTRQSNESDVIGREQDTPIYELFKKKNKRKKSPPEAGSGMGQF